MSALASSILNGMTPPPPDMHISSLPDDEQFMEPTPGGESPIDPARQAVIDGRAMRSLRAREAEKAREAQLRADPLAEVLGPYAVRCVRCGNSIRLSRKSTYELEHWRKHITRCSKRQPGETRPGRTHARNLSTDSAPPTNKSVGARARAATRASHSSNTPPVDLGLDTASTARYGTRSTRRQEASKPSPPGDTPEPSEAVFFGSTLVCGVPPPVVHLRWSGQKSAEEATFDERAVISTFQEQIGRALKFDPPRRGDWSFACLKRTGFAAVSSGGQLPSSAGAPP